jgi:hypothetical protein
MKRVSWLLIISFSLIVFACHKKEKSERFLLLTTPTWATDSLLANGDDASGTGQLLEKFKGDAKFSEDGSGTFGKYTGVWRFNEPETEVTIVTDSLVLPIICDIVKLTSYDLKITTVVPDKNTGEPIDIRMTFKAK